MRRQSGHPRRPNAADDDHSLSLVWAAKNPTSDQVLAVVDPAWNGPIWMPVMSSPEHFRAGRPYVQGAYDYLNETVPDPWLIVTSPMAIEFGLSSHVPFDFLGSTAAFVMWRVTVPVMPL